MWMGAAVAADDADVAAVMGAAVAVDAAAVDADDVAVAAVMHLEKVVAAARCFVRHSSKTSLFIFDASSNARFLGNSKRGMREYTTSSWIS